MRRDLLQDGDDEVPKQWLPPYAGPGAMAAGSAERAPSAGRGGRAGGSARAGPRVGPRAGGRALAQDVRISSKPDLRGLGQALARGGERGTLGCAPTKVHPALSMACPMLLHYKSGPRFAPTLFKRLEVPSVCSLHKEARVH